MLIIVLLASFTGKVSTTPVRPDVLPPLLSQGGATQAPQVQPVEATNQKPQALTPLSPIVEQAQHEALQLPGAQGGPQVYPSLQQYIWSLLGGSPMMIPLQPGVQESLAANQPAPPQQPLVFSPYGYFPQLFSPYGNQLSSTLGSSSEELETPAKIGQLGVYMPNVLTNLPVGAVQPVSQGAGLANPEQQSIAPTGGKPSAGVPQTQRLASSGPQPNTNRVAGLERAAQAAAPAHTSVQPTVQPTPGNRAQGCSHQ
ncbi:hypothetical protein EXN66_Car003364 [Channa argus]|uniref:Ameloblastin n=1 Tax=Channa argus TaxID=215402 RepID=A0A6G1PBS8_CHAAH|nr:hypothetical protein EXN66_Car003364 [Channa argus]